MEEKKEEGKAGSDSGKIALTEEGGLFSSGVDDQILNIEAQLKKAQSTLLDLQKLKEKLEEEREINIEKAKAEKERLQAEKVKEENEKLKSELKGYQTEINSMKGIIASLRKDLVDSTQELKSKVDISLKILEEAEEKIEKKEKAIHVSEHSDTHRHVEEKHEENEAEHHGHSHHEEKAVHHHKAEEKETKRQDDEPGADISTSQADKLPEEAKKEVEPEKIDKPAEISDKPAETEKPAEAQKQPEPQAKEVEETPEPVYDELKEYEKIKQELEALENGSAANNSSSQPVSQPAPTPMQAPTTPEIKPTQEQQSPSPIPENSPPTPPANSKIQWKGNDPFGDNKKSKLSFFGRILGVFNLSRKRKIEAAVKQEIKVQAADQVTPANSQIMPQPVAEATPQQQAQPAPAQAPEPTQPQAPTQPESSTPIAQAEAPAEQPQTQAPADAASTQPATQEETSPEQPAKPAEAKEKDEDKKHKGGAGKMIMKAAVVILVIASAYFTYQIKNADKLRATYISQAQQNRIAAANDNAENSDASFQSISKPPEEKYKEAFADIPFNNTIWENFKSDSLGISFLYPGNTSHKLQPIGSESVWILRKEGYLFKAERIETTQNLEEYVNSYKPPVVYKVDVTNFKGKVAVSLTPEEALPVQGSTYLIQGQGCIVKLWFKTFKPGENPDDEKRVQKMIDTFTFTQ